MERTAHDVVLLNGALEKYETIICYGSLIACTQALWSCAYSTRSADRASRHAFSLLSYSLLLLLPVVSSSSGRFFRSSASSSFLSCSFLLCFPGQSLQGYESAASASSSGPASASSAARKEKEREAAPADRSAGAAAAQPSGIARSMSGSGLGRDEANPGSPASQRSQRGSAPPVSFSSSAFLPLILPLSLCLSLSWTSSVPWPPPSIPNQACAFSLSSSSPPVPPSLDLC